MRRMEYRNTEHTLVLHRAPRHNINKRGINATLLTNLRTAIVMKFVSFFSFSSPYRRMTYVAAAFLFSAIFTSIEFPQRNVTTPTPSRYLNVVNMLSCSQK